MNTRRGFMGMVAGAMAAMLSPWRKGEAQTFSSFTRGSLATACRNLDMPEAVLWTDPVAETASEVYAARGKSYQEHYRDSVLMRAEIEVRLEQMAQAAAKHKYDLITKIVTNPHG